jgi:hypothetical protein
LAWLCGHRGFESLPFRKKQNSKFYISSITHIYICGLNLRYIYLYDNPFHMIAFNISKVGYETYIYI